VHPHIYGFNHKYNSTINAVPLTRLHGTTVNISPLLQFHFWERIHYLKSETSFPPDSKEGLGNIVGVSEHCGHTLTYKVLTANTGHIIYRSLLCPANTDDANLRASMFAGEPDTHHAVVKSRNDFLQPRNMDEYKPATTISPSPVFNPLDGLF
jgi:hypothetical protein